MGMYAFGGLSDVHAARSIPEACTENDEADRAEGGFERRSRLSKLVISYFRLSLSISSSSAQMRFMLRRAFRSTMACAISTPASSDSFEHVVAT